MVALCRIRAEAGVAWHFGPWVKPYQLPVRIYGESAIAPRSLTALAAHGWYNLEYRSTPMPHQIEGMKIAEEGRFRAARHGVLDDGGACRRHHRRLLERAAPLLPARGPVPPR